MCEHTNWIAETKSRCHNTKSLGFIWLDWNALKHEALIGCVLLKHQTSNLVYCLICTISLFAGFWADKPGWY